MITIQVNEKHLEIKPDLNILQLLIKLDSPLDGIAVAVNNSIISRMSWTSKTLTDNDSVLIIQATQGG